MRKITGCACAGNAGNSFPCQRLQRKPLVSDPGMDYGTSVRSRHSWRMHNPQFYVSLKRSMLQSGCVQTQKFPIISQVQLEMYKQGSRVAYATFNATGSDKMGWMNISRLVNSSWMDIRSYDKKTPPIAAIGGLRFRYVLGHSHCLNPTISVASCHICEISGHGKRQISQISQSTCPISHNVPLRNKNMYISVLNGALYDMGQVH